MNTKSNFKAEANGALRRLISYLALNVFAEEETGTSSTNPAPTSGASSTTGDGNSINFEQLIRVARQEEKDKLYPQINSLKEKNKTLTESLNEALLNSATWKQKYDTLEAKMNSGEDTEEVKNLKAQIETLKQENEQLKSNTPDETAIRAQVEAEFKVKNHLEKVKEQNKDTVLNVFMDEITGDTIEAIDQSLAKAIEKSNSVREQVTGGKQSSTSNSASNEGSANSGTTPNPVPPVANPSGSNTPKQLDVDYIRSLQPGTPEYDEFRKSIGLK